MTTLLEIPLNDVSPSILYDLQIQYPNGAVLRIDVADVLTTMNEAQFWAIIAQFDWRTLDSEAILAPAAKALSRLSK